MTTDSHVRLYVSGRRQQLAVLASMFWTSEDPKEAARLEAAYYRRNRRIARSLAAKGFNKFTINMTLHAGLIQVGSPGDAREGQHAVMKDPRGQ
ncbi:hypothetical protein BH24GEM1_BH24GEM1_01820 [soil metagenome]